MSEEEIKKREEQFSKTISDIENIQCLAQYLLDAIRTGEDPDGEGKEIDYSFVKDICHDIKVFNDSTIMICLLPFRTALCNLRMSFRPF